MWAVLHPFGYPRLQSAVYFVNRPVPESAFYQVHRRNTFSKETCYLFLFALNCRSRVGYTILGIERWLEASVSTVESTSFGSTPMPTLTTYLTSISRPSSVDASTVDVYANRQTIPLRYRHSQTQARLRADADQNGLQKLVERHNERLDLPLEVWSKEVIAEAVQRSGTAV